MCSIHPSLLLLSITYVYNPSDQAAAWQEWPSGEQQPPEGGEAAAGYALAEPAALQGVGFDGFTVTGAAEPEATTTTTTTGDEANEEILCAQNLVGRVIGRHGETIRDLQVCVFLICKVELTLV